MKTGTNHEMLFYEQINIHVWIFRAPPPPNSTRTCWNLNHLFAAAPSFFCLSDFDLSLSLLSLSVFSLSPSFFSLSASFFSFSFSSFALFLASSFFFSASLLLILFVMRLCRASMERIRDAKYTCKNNHHKYYMVMNYNSKVLHFSVAQCNFAK